MDLALSSRGRYALRAAVFLAAEYRSGALRTQQQVSDAMDVPRRFVLQVLGDLVRSGLVVSVHGVHGGYRLARPPGQVRLLDVVEAGEGLLDSAGGVQGKGPSERTASHLQALLTEAGTRFRRVLAYTTLEQLVGPADAAAPHPGSLPCGVLAVWRAQGAAVGMHGGLAAHEDPGEELFERRFDRVGTPPPAQRRHGDHGEDHAVEEERDQ